VIGFRAAALPCGDAGTLGCFGVRVVDVPVDEVAEDFRRAAFPAAFSWRASGEEGVPVVIWDADVAFWLALAWHRSSLPGGIPVSLENRLRVGSHPGKLSSSGY